MRTTNQRRNTIILLHMLRMFDVIGTRDMQLWYGKTFHYVKRIEEGLINEK